MGAQADRIELMILKISQAVSDQMYIAGDFLSKPWRQALNHSSFYTL